MTETISNIVSALFGGSFFLLWLIMTAGYAAKGPHAFAEPEAAHDEPVDPVRLRRAPFRNFGAERPKSDQMFTLVGSGFIGVATLVFWLSALTMKWIWFFGGYFGLGFILTFIVLLFGRLLRVPIFSELADFLFPLRRRR